MNTKCYWCGKASYKNLEVCESCDPFSPNSSTGYATGYAEDYPREDEDGCTGCSFGCSECEADQEYTY